MPHEREVIFCRTFVCEHKMRTSRASSATMTSTCRTDTLLFAVCALVYRVPSLSVSRVTEAPAEAQQWTENSLWKQRKNVLRWATAADRWRYRGSGQPADDLEAVL